MPRTSFPAAWLGLPILIVLILAVAVAAGGALAACVWFAASAPQPPSPIVDPPVPVSDDTNPVATLSAAELWDAFGKNTDDADARYKGKWVKISGNVVAATRDGNTVSVGLQVATGTALTIEELKDLPDRERRWYKEGFPPNVVCYSAKGAEGRLAALRRGDRVELVGRVVGRKAADVWHDYIVLLEGCRLVGPGSD
jgi:hypothetical protein